MRISDHGITKTRKRTESSKALTQVSVVGRLPTTITILSQHQFNINYKNRLLQAKRTREISTNLFNINAYSDEDCLVNFRFLRADIPKISKLVEFNTPRTIRNRYRMDPIASTCIMLRRISAPARWRDLELVFFMNRSALSEVFWETIERFTKSNSYLLDLRTNLLRQRAKIYAEAIKYKGAPLHQCIGFIDCTKIRMCRPGGHGTNQRSVYSGHKRMHCLSYQTLTTPDGLIFALWGPEVGRRHDLTLLRKSGWEEIFSESLLIDGVQHYIYCDAAYNLRPYMQVPFVIVGEDEQKKAFNKSMSKMRVSVEWSYGEVKKIGLSTIMLGY